MADQEEDQGITAYHGSPHEFEQFDLSKIGTGEGAQAYGHGLYFAESEPVAHGYKERLAPPANVQSSGQNITKQQLKEIVEELGLPYASATAANAFGRLQKSDSVENYLNQLNQIDREQLRKTFPKVAEEVDAEHALFSELHRRGLDIDRPNKGHMYEVSINAHPDHFLDWDKPLSEQSEHVKNAVINHAKLSGFEHYTPQGENAPVVLNKGISGDTVGNNLYKWFGDGNAEKASQMLNFYGIKGIKYLDAGSRGKSENPTRNYVVFDDKLVNVKRRYARGGRVGYADGGSPSIAQKIIEYAETLPTTEENIETLKQLGRNVGESAYDLGKRVISGFAKRAEQASERTPPTNVRVGERPVYVEPKREAPPQRRYILPDGRMGSISELELSNEMAKERFNEQYPMTRVVQENMPSLPTQVSGPAPTRAPIREKLKRQEQRANVDRPIVLPERKGFDWPQVYKDIMSDEPQMEWTKGMTPREQAPPPPSSGGSILGGSGEGQGGHKYVEGGPLELTVTANRQPIEPRDVYIPSSKNPNPFHSSQTMVARAPEYEGQVVPIPDTPEDRMGEYHLSKIILPIRALQKNPEYTAKQGLEDYNPPVSATGERFPNQGDVDFYRGVDATYGRPEAGYLQQGARGSYYDDLSKMADRQGGYRRTMTPQESDAFNAAYIAAQRNPIAALGFRPEEFDFSGNPIPQTTAGSVLGPSSRIYADLKFPSVAVHEAIHRGLMEIKNEDYNAYRAKVQSLLGEMKDIAEQPYNPERQQRVYQISDELRALHENKTSPDIFEPGRITDPEGKEDEQELFVRSLMYKMFGPVEGYELERQLVEGDVIKEYPPEKLERFMIDNADRISRLEQRALSMLQRRAAERERGPRASGGSVRRGYAIGGNPGDMATGGYGTGISGVTGSVDRNVAAGGTESNFTGGGQSWSGGGGSSSSGNDGFSWSRGDSDNDLGPGLGFGGAEIMSPLSGISNGVLMAFPERSHEQMMAAMGIEGPADTSGLPAALKPGGNIGAALAKEALDPNPTSPSETVGSGGMFNPSSDMPTQFGMGVRQAGFPTQQTGLIDPRNQGYAEQMAKTAREAYLQSTKPLDPTSSENAYNFNEPFVGGISDERIAEIQRQLHAPIGQPMGPVKPQPTLPDSAFGGTLIDPTGQYTQDALDQMKVVSDGVTMLNSPTLAGAFVRAFTPTPTPATPQQQAAIERMYRRDLNTSIPANFATPEGMAQRYGAPGATPLARPGQTSTAYLNAGPSASTGRQDMPVRSVSATPSPSSDQTPKQNFENAFAAARARGDETFSWTNPATGRTMLYTTQLARKQGGRIPSLSEPDQWVAEPLKPRNVAKISKPRKTSKIDGTAIVKRASMLSSRKS